MSTLKPTPSFNKNIPVVTPGGGTALAYKDPNSPESILRNTAVLYAQSIVDTKYDVNTSPYYEGFTSGGGFIINILILFGLLFFGVYTSKKISIRTGALVILVVCICIFLAHRGE